MDVNKMLENKASEIGRLVDEMTEISVKIAKLNSKQERLLSKVFKLHDEYAELKKVKEHAQEVE